MPVAVLLLRLALGTPWVAFGDYAVIEIRTRDVFSAHSSLVGLYSRMGWNHPGPLIFWVLALPYRAAGATGTGLLVGAVLVNALALLVIAVIGWRRGGADGLLVVIVPVLLLTRALGAGFVVDPWTPRVVVLPLLATAVLGWSALAGGRWSLPMAVGAGTFAVQSQVGTTIAVALVLAAAAVGMRRDRTAVALAVVVGLVLWLPPLVDALRGNGGNLAAIVRYWMHSEEPATGFGFGARVVALQLSAWPPWLSGDAGRSMFTGTVDPPWRIPWMLPVLLGAGGIALRRRDRGAAALVVVALAVLLTAFVSAARIHGPAYDYLVQWMWLVGALAWIAVAWTAWRAALRFPGRRHGRVAGVAATAALGLVLTIGAARCDLTLGRVEAPLRSIEPTLRRVLPTLPPPVLVAPSSDPSSLGVATAVLAMAIRTGVDARAPELTAAAFGGHRTIAPENAATQLFVATDGAAAAFGARPDVYRSVAVHDPLSTAERAEREALDAESRETTSASPDQLLDRLLRIDALAERGPRIELFARVSPPNDR